MLTKRRLAAQAVDGAFFGGDGRLAVSFRNGASHARAAQGAADAAGSRVAAHSFAGEQCVDGWLNGRSEHVVAVAVSCDGVVACRVCDSASSRPRRAEKIVFLTGRHRLSEMLTAAVDDGPSRTTAADQLRLPMLCLRTPAGQHTAVFTRDGSTLFACTSHGDGASTSAPSAAPARSRERQLRFSDATIACLGAGRGCSAGEEATVLLAGGTVVLCGFPAQPHDDGDDDDDGFPSFRPLLTCAPAADAPPPPTAAPPVRVAWAGSRTLWVAYADGTLSAMRVAPLSGAAAELRVVFVGSLAAPGQDVAQERLFLHTDGRTTALHYCLATRRRDADGDAGGDDADDATLHYGTVRLPAGAGRGPAAAKVELFATPQHRAVQFGEAVYGLRYDGGQYHILSQTAPGVGPLRITTLPRAVPHAGSDGDSAGGLARLPFRIMNATEAQLGALCREVESRIRGINDRSSAATTLLSGDAVQRAMSELHLLRRSVSALQAREQQQQQQQQLHDGADLQSSGGGVAFVARPAQSYPQRLLQLHARKHAEVAVYQLLAQLHCLDEGVTRPLSDVLDLVRCREAAAGAEGLLKQHIVANVFPVSTETEVVHAKLWPARPALCLDVVLAELGVPASASLAHVVAESPAVVHGSSTPSPALALLVLYYTYRSLFITPPSSSGDAAIPQPPSCEQQRLENEVRQRYLTQCGLPATSLNLWAFASCAVDHAIDPTARQEGEEGEGEDGEEAPPLYLLGAAVRHLDAPPLLHLLPAVVNGLLNALALDAAHCLAAATLSIYAAGGELPPSLGLKLLFVALQTGSSHIIESVFLSSRGTVLAAVAAQALALAALQMGDVAVMRGLIVPGSAEERVVEGTLRAWEDVSRREAVLLRFYILTQRFTDALQVCGAVAARDPVEGQRLSAVISHLRSLCPHGNVEYMRRGEGTGAGDREEGAASPAPPPHAASSAALCEPGSPTGRLVWAGVAPTPLESSRGELEDHLRRAVARGTGGGAFAARPSMIAARRMSSTTGAAAAMRPSSILSSLDRSSIVAPASARGGAVPNRSSSGADLNEESGAGPTRLDTTASFHREEPQPQHRPQHLSHGRSILGYSGSAAAAMTCDAVLQRSGKVCGRPRPCQYHDRK